MRPTPSRSLPAPAAVSVAALVAAVALHPQSARAQAPVRVWQDTLTIPTYEEGLPDPNPPFDFFRPRRVNYPYTIRDNLTDRRRPRVWRTLELENEFLRCTVLPDLGGHLYGCTDRVNGAEVFYRNSSIKLTRIGYRGAWAALGVEFNFPVSHNWMSTSPVDFGLSTDPDGSGSVWVGNIDRVHGTSWRVRLTLRPGRAVLEQHTVLYNRSDFRHRFYWWTNAAVRAWDDTRILYPMRHTASHGFRDIDTWPVDSQGTDNSVVGNHLHGPVSRFSHGSREPFMAVYHPRTDAGVVHYSPATDLPAKKIWSFGGDANGLRWREALSDDRSAYVEIQRGLFRDQETYGFLEPQEEVRFAEYWIPVREIGGVTRANPEAVLHVGRDPAGPGLTTLVVGLNVTEARPGATLQLREGNRTVRGERVDLHPGRTVRARYPDLPVDGTYTVEVRDSGGRVLVAHTEGVFDITPDERIDVGPVPRYEYPPPDRRTESDVLGYGDWLEREGRRLEALEAYETGLARFPVSVPIHRAAGILAVSVKRYDLAVRHLRWALERVSNDYEASYSLGQALRALGDTAGARSAWEDAQRYGLHRPAALFRLAALDARAGERLAALERIREAVEAAPGSVRSGAMEVALLRTLGRDDDARRRLEHWRYVDPTSSHLRYEGRLLGLPDDGLDWHLAGDPERILEIAVDYLAFGLRSDALVLLARDYPRGEWRVAEPGAPHPSEHPMVAYYRAFTRAGLGQDPGPDLAVARGLSTRYVFPNRHESIPVLEWAVRTSPDDATARFLLGALYLSGGRGSDAMEQWERVRQLRPSTPTLHRNMGYTLLYAGADARRAAEVFREGLRYDEANVGLYFGLDDALERAGAPVSVRADALASYPDPAAMPSDLVYRLARRLAAAGRFDEAEALFRDRFFPSEEGGTNVREVWLEVRLARAASMAEAGECREALAIVEGLDRAVAGLAFTRDGMTDFLDRQGPREGLARVRGPCGGQDGRPGEQGPPSPA